MTMTAQATPRIYVACLAAYNNGHLHGRWIDANQSPDQIEAEIHAMLSESPISGAEEWAIHDYDNFGGLQLGEHENLEQIAELADLMEQHGSLLPALVRHVGGLNYLDRAKDLLSDGHLGAYDSLEAYAEEFLEETGALDMLPEHLRCYFDHEQYARDLELNGDVFTIEVDGKVHVFDNHV